MPLVRALALLAAAVLAPLALAACGDGDGSTDKDRAATAAIDLTITLEGTAGTRAFTLRCDPVGGTWPDAATACRGLATPDGAKALEPIVIETRDYGPITEVPMTVTGTVDGRALTLEFPKMGSSTRRARLRMLIDVLGPDAYATAVKAVS